MKSVDANEERRGGGERWDRKDENERTGGKWGKGVGDSSWRDDGKLRIPGRRIERESGRALLHGR